MKIIFLNQKQFGVFNDLGSGTIYGSRSYSHTDIDQVLGIPLNADAISALNSALGGEFALGGALTSIDTNGSEFIFGGRANTTRRLVLTIIPEPSTALLVALGLVGLAIRKRKRI